MSRYAGVIRDADGLRELLRIIAQTGGFAGSATCGWEAEPSAGGAPARSSAGRAAGRAGDDALGQTGDLAGSGGRSGGEREVEHGTVRDGLDLDGVEAANLRTVSLLIAAGALRRAESRGCHRRRDAGGASPAPWHTLARWDGQELVLTEEAL